MLLCCFELPSKRVENNGLREKLQNHTMLINSIAPVKVINGFEIFKLRLFWHIITAWPYRYTEYVSV